MKLTLSFVSLAAVAAAAPFKAAVWSKVAGGDGKPHFRIGLAGGEPPKGYSTPSDIRSVQEPDVELIHIMPFPATPPTPADYISSEYGSPPLVPEDMILPSVVSEPHGHNMDHPVASTKPCHGMSDKSVELSNWLRQAMGMPPIAIEPVHARPSLAVLHVEFKPVPARVHVLPAIGSTAPPKDLHTHNHHHSTSKEHKHKNKQHSHTKTKTKDWNKRPFADRLTHALMSLGRWEGRIVAFVLGCGIGVLLRLVWVMGVLSYRSLRNRRSEEDEDEHEHEIFLTEEEAYNLPAPEYTNEKVALAEQK